jgi:uncharacterized protein
MRVEVAYARPREQLLIMVDLRDGATLEAALRASGILDRFPEIDLATANVGIFGKPCALHQELRPGDRVEIYRPLLADPRAARRERVQRR